MKRRIFSAAASTVGIAGAVSSTSLVSSAYSSISTSVLLEEFPTSTRSILDKFMADVSLNIKAHGINEKFAKLATTPVQIVSKSAKGNNQNVTFKNKTGEYISLSVANGVEQISISNYL